jgi:hypothetical protein
MRTLTDRPLTYDERNMMFDAIIDDSTDHDTIVYYMAVLAEDDKASVVEAAEGREIAV